MSDLPVLQVAGTAVIYRPGSETDLPVVLLHGIGSDARSWAGVLAALDPAISAFAWDAPGYGVSVTLDGAARAPEAYAARLLAVLDALSVERVIVVGHSLGCLFAGAFAVAHPRRVAAVALLSPALGYRVPPDAPLPPGAQGRLDDLAALGAAGMAEKRAARLVFRPEEKPIVLVGVRRAMAAVRPDGYAGAVRALATGDLLGDARRIAAPALVAIGAEDVVTPPSNARAVVAVLPNLMWHVEVPATGHALPQEEPAVVARLLSDLREAARG